MTPEAVLEQLYNTGSIDDLKTIIRQVQSVAEPYVVFNLGGATLQVEKIHALKLARLILRNRTATGVTISENLRIAAELTPPTDQAGVRNLATWVGLNTPEWHAVFEYSDDRPERTSPWFVFLDTQAQRICLDLIAEILEG